MYTVKIWIISRYENGSDIEEIEITSEKSLASAKNRATRWVNKNYFSCDIDKIVKDKFETRKRASMTLHLKNDWEN